MPRKIAALAVASGMCGIAYELLYARMLTSYLGDMFHVAASILATFLLGIAAGSSIAHRFTRWLWAVEVGIGVYAAFVATLFGGFGRELQEVWLPITSGSVPALVLVVSTLLFVPALLIGFSVPLFALLLREHARELGRDAVFRAVYSHYNLGAALCVLLVEFVVLRALGIGGSLLLLALVNLTAGLLLLRIPSPSGAPLLETPSATCVGSAPKAGLLVLFAVSVASGVYQMFLYKLAEMTFGPFHENFALVLAFVLLGIVTGTACVARLGSGLSRWLIGGSAAVALSLLGVAPLVVLFAKANGTIGVVPALSTTLKITVLGAMSAAPLAVFGGTIPALLGELRDAREQAGRALAISSLGNCAGYLMMVLWLYAALPDRVIAAGLAGTLLLAGLFLAWRQETLPGIRPVVGVTALVATLGFAWPTTFLHYGYDAYASASELAKAQRLYEGVEVHRRYDSQIALLRDATGGESLVINGYQSLVASSDGHTNLRELIYGLVPALYSAERKHALVLGVGTGITAAATASTYERTTAVEVNPSMLELLPRFSEHNLELTENPRVELLLEDGLAALLRGTERFDAIVNTVTSPLYFSSSKLYTREFFALAAERLAPGGVYALWFDGRVTQDGARVIFQTLNESFADCAVTYLNTTYLQLICANERVRARDPADIAWDPEVRKRISMSGPLLPLETLLRAIALPRHRLFTEKWNTSPNTLDRPVLEFLMASRAVSHQDWWSPYDLLDVDLGAMIAPGARPHIEGLAARCYALRVMGFSDVEACLALLSEADPTGLSLYAGHLLRHETDRSALLSPNERLALSGRLLAAGDPDRAEALVQDVSFSPRLRGVLLSLRTRIRVERGESISDADLAALYTAAPLDPEARALIIRALQRRGEVAMAKAHARFLPGLGPLTPASTRLLQSLEIGGTAQ